MCLARAFLGNFRPQCRHGSSSTGSEGPKGSMPSGRPPFIDPNALTPGGIVDPPTGMSSRLRVPPPPTGMSSMLMLFFFEPPTGTSSKLVFFEPPTGTSSKFVFLDFPPTGTSSRLNGFAFFEPPTGISSKFIGGFFLPPPMGISSKFMGGLFEVFFGFGFGFGLEALGMTFFSCGAISSCATDVDRGIASSFFTARLSEVFSLWRDVIFRSALRCLVSNCASVSSKVSFCLASFDSKPSTRARSLPTSSLSSVFAT
mmetsp:Transcript_31221/g.58194  ORF Transcript_31221/g.58194 Transcript_31221/m.58194 type:complete len:257 (-) Transcript_31221:205-975(-)